MDKILIIDDNADLRNNFAEMLRLNNYVVCEAGNGQDGLLIAMQEVPQIILCDIHMPIMDGYDVFLGIKANSETAHIPFVFFTATVESAHQCKSMDIGADDFICKTVSEETLLSTVRCRISKGKQIMQDMQLEKQKYIAELEDLAITVSHSVRSPLCSNLGLFNLLDTNHLKEEDLKKILSAIKTSTLKLDDYTKDFTERIDRLVKSKQTNGKSRPGD